MPHRFVLKDAYWKMRIDHPYSMAAASDDLAVTCGQASIGKNGEVLFPGRLLAQSRQIIETQEKIFSDLGISGEDLSKVVVFTSERRSTQLEECLGRFRQILPTTTPVYSIVIPPLFYDDLLIEVDLYASPPKPDAGAMPRLVSVVIEVEFDSAEPEFSGGLGASAFSALSDALEQKGLTFESAVKLSCYAPTAKIQFWEALAAHRLRWFGSCVPAISDVVSASPIGNARLQLDVTCVPNCINWPSIVPVGEQLERGHPEAVIVGPLLFTSALFSPPNISTPHDTIEEEVGSIMRRHGALLQSVDMSFANVIKANSFYQGSGSAEELHENMSIRNAYYQVPGPASTGLPVSGFPYAGKRTSIELIAART